MPKGSWQVGGDRMDGILKLALKNYLRGTEEKAQQLGAHAALQ